MTRYCSGVYNPYTMKYNVTVYFSITPNDCFVITKIISFAVKLDAFTRVISSISPVIDPNFNKITEGVKPVCCLKIIIVNVIAIAFLGHKFAKHI